jgi:hypothetical protein
MAGGVAEAAEQAAAAKGLAIECVDIISKNSLGETFVQTTCRPAGVPDAIYLYDGNEIIKPNGVDILRVELSHGIETNAGYLQEQQAHIISQDPRNPTFAANPALATVWSEQGSIAATNAALLQLRQGNAQQQAIAATGEFVVSSSGQIIVTGTTWWAIAQPGPPAPGVTPGAPGGSYIPPKAPTPAPLAGPSSPAPSPSSGWGSYAPDFAKVKPGSGIQPLFVGPAPIPIPEPITFTIVAIVTTVLAGLFRLFGGGVNAATRAALDQLRGALSASADSLMRFAHAIVRGLGRLLQAVSMIYVRLIAPLLRRVLELSFRFARFLDKTLKPLIALIRKYRQLILDYYEKYARPVLLAIQRIRQVLNFLKLFHLKWADKLDAYLKDLEARIIAPMQYFLQVTGVLIGWINLILDAGHRIQEPILINSLVEYGGSLSAIAIAPHFRELTPAERAALLPPPSTSAYIDPRLAVDQYVRFGTGVLADKQALIRARFPRGVGG